MSRLHGRFRIWALGAWLAVVAIVTLHGVEASGPGSAAIPGVCLICGERGTADAILNVFMFMPLGLLLHGQGRALARAVVTGLVVAVLIELVQTAVPGRHASPADVVWNVTGSGLGAWMVVVWRVRLPERRPHRELGWVALVTVGFIVVGLLLTPSFTHDSYWGQWTPELGHMPAYDGAVLRAELNGRPLPPNRLNGEDSHHELFSGPWSLWGRIVLGSPPEEPSPILSIYDGHQREIVLLGAHREDLVFRFRTLADRLRLDSPDVRLTDAFEGATPGDTVDIGARYSEGRVCLLLDQLERCDVGVTPGRAWGLLLYPEGTSRTFRMLLDWTWMLLLFMPLGLLAGSVGEAIAAGLLAIGGTLLAVGLTPLVAGPWHQWLGASTGVALGLLVIHRLRPAAPRP